MTSRPTCASSADCMARSYSLLSHWARRHWTAGPLLVFSMRMCVVLASVTSAICPPRASTSRVTVPFAGPPILQLHDIRPIDSRDSVMSSV